MRLLPLPLKDNPYTIHIGSGLLQNKQPLSSFCEGENVLIVTNQLVAPLYLDKVKNTIVGKTVYHLLIDDGEVNKSRESLFKIIDFLVENNFRRNDTLIALGGGVIGDLAGFAAASYQRGMNLVQVPTTLLSQVDSSVGGKTAINHQQGKNLIGAFYQPSAVIIDVDTLDSLPKREYLSGFGEIVKYALLGEKQIAEILQNNVVSLKERNKPLLEELIFLSCQMKASIVARDEKEKGERALLNLGHTFAHAIETLTDYKRFLHGEAVSIGILMALSISAKKSLINSQVVKQYHQLIFELGLPVAAGIKLASKDFVAAMRKDKKNQSGAIRLVLATPSGCILEEENDFQLITEIINQYCS
jgi:3-dehydroquinate synthase